MHLRFAVKLPCIGGRKSTAPVLLFAMKMLIYKRFTAKFTAFLNKKEKQIALVMKKRYKFNNHVIGCHMLTGPQNHQLNK